MILLVQFLVHPSKKMTLTSMKYPGDEFFNRFLSSCLVLEDLVVKQCPDDNVEILSVRVPSLKSLGLHKLTNKVKNDVHGFVIDAPSLECLEIVDYSCGFCVIENSMPKIVEADVDILSTQTKQLLGSITSVKRLYMCLSTSKDAYPLGSVFHSLVHLKICTCMIEWLNLLMCMLRDSPNLQSLELNQCHSLRDEEPRPCWNEPSSFPEDLLSSLETFKWVKYHGTEEQKELAAFILRSASCLKKATIISSDSTNSDQKLELLKELSLSSRRSPACRLEFK